ncbi:MAG: hypothetical protein FJ190_09640 [Gammaproteobacteria bacterium]|nr:hypothetical protein [Gammaproteobacteria bacterium]
MTEQIFHSLPIPEIASQETDKSDKSDFSLISNADFITGIFGEIVGAERPIVVSFEGNPSEVSKSAWFGMPWITGKTPLIDERNNYISFASFRPDESGKYRRQKKQFAALYAVMLDDVGNKVPLGRITLQPSWMIETSMDNFQLGFILAEPITHPLEADQLLTAIINAGLTDPGANGPCSRLGRLPVATNGKHLSDEGMLWRCRLTGWQPHLRYSVQAIVEGLQIELKETAQQRRTHARKNVDHDQHQDDVHIPRASENPVIVALKESRRYKQP